MKTAITCFLFWSAGILWGVAAPDEFVLDEEAFRHGTHDRIWKPQAVYVDKDGLLLYPVGDRLIAAGRDWIERILSFFPDDRRRMIQYRVYIHPAARWAAIHGFVTWIEAQKIGVLSLHVARLREDGHHEQGRQTRPNKSE